MFRVLPERLRQYQGKTERQPAVRVREEDVFVPQPVVRIPGLFRGLPLPGLANKSLHLDLIAPQVLPPFQETQHQP